MTVLRWIFLGLLVLAASPLAAQVPPPDLSLKQQAEPVPEAADEPTAEPAVAQEPVEPRIIVIGSAPVAGTFYPAAGALCREINRWQAVNGLRCLVEETEGSQENLERLAEGTLDLAVVQSDWVYHATNGSAEGLSGPFTSLRSLLLLQPQVVTLVAGADSGVLGLGDLAGKRLSIGPAGSGINGFGRNLIEQLQLSEVVTVDMAVEAQSAALCSGEIDAFLVTVAHPNGVVAEAVDLCGAVMVNVEGEAVDRLVANWPFYAKVVLPAALYRGHGDPVTSFGLVTTLVTTEAFGEDEAYAVLQAVFDGLDDFRLQHPTLQILSAESMSGTGFAAPLHPAAERFYHDRGLR